MLNDKTITLFSVAWGEELWKIFKVAEDCYLKFPFFDEIKILTHISNMEEYSRFMVEDLYKYINTDFVMVFQSDGFILNPNLWHDDFLNYDYIGAPWPWHGICGNGGFCLRSKKFTEISSLLKYNPKHDEYKINPEDEFLCLQNRDFLIEKGIKIADYDTAKRFSFETRTGTPNEGPEYSFGFHGKHNL